MAEEFARVSSRAMRSRSRCNMRRAAPRLYLFSRSGEHLADTKETQAAAAFPARPLPAAVQSLMTRYDSRQVSDPCAGGNDSHERVNEQASERASEWTNERTNERTRERADWWRSRERMRRFHVFRSTRRRRRYIDHLPCDAHRRLTRVTPRFSTLLYVMLPKKHLPFVKLLIVINSLFISSLENLVQLYRFVQFFSISAFASASLLLQSRGFFLARWFRWCFRSVGEYLNAANATKVDRFDLIDLQ